ncbi:MAG: flagellar filament capping protein FliD [Gammaproteobacteria bacterium]|nr:flagellar filament capping protein FliD [Gammaproteobacteria bacterium]
MAAITSLGVGSGLDLGTLVSGLIEAERAPVENRLNQKQLNFTTELSAFGLLRSSLSQFQTSLDGLKNSSAFNAKAITASDASVFSTSVESFADIGSYSVEVLAMAKAQSLATSAATAFATVDDVIGSGTLTVQFGTTTTSPSYSFTPDPARPPQAIDISAANGNDTVSGLRDYINDNDFGFQASIVDDGTNGYRLVFTSEDTGAANSMELTVTADGDGNDNDNAGLSQLAFNASAQGSLIQNVEAQDASLTINGLGITRDTNSISGAINGVTLDLLKADVGNIVNVDVNEDRAEITATINGFVEAYNELTESIKSLTSYDAETGTGSVLIGDFTVRSISSQIRSVLFGSISGLQGNIKSLVDIGITTNSNGTLDIDSAKLSDALDNYPSEVEALFGIKGITTDPGVSYVSSTSDTEPGDYAINVSQVLTQGVLTGSGPVAATPIVISNANDNRRFGIIVDGFSTGNFNFSNGTYNSEADLATMMQGRINTRLSGNATVTVTYDATADRFLITSDSSGPSSTVEITRVDTNTFADLGLSVSTGVDGTDTGREVTIDGVIATANGQIFTSESGPSNGLSVELLTNTPGNRGTVTVSNGLAGTLDGILDAFLLSDGTIASREESLNEGLEDIEDERFRLEDRILALEARLIRQFSALDALIAQFNQTSSFLTQQLANLPKPNTINSND